MYIVNMIITAGAKSDEKALSEQFSLGQRLTRSAARLVCSKEPDPRSWEVAVKRRAKLVGLKIQAIHKIS